MRLRLPTAHNQKHTSRRVAAAEKDVAQTKPQRPRGKDTDGAKKQTQEGPREREVRDAVEEMIVGLRVALCKAVLDNHLVLGLRGHDEGQEVEEPKDEAQRDADALVGASKESGAETTETARAVENVKDSHCDNDYYCYIIVYVNFRM